jgi:hypothetical protein
VAEQSSRTRAPRFRRLAADIFVRFAAHEARQHVATLAPLRLPGHQPCRSVRLNPRIRQERLDIETHDNQILDPVIRPASWFSVRLSARALTR